MEQPQIADGIEATAMIIRQGIMQHYKGSCIDELVPSSNITVHAAERRTGTNCQRHAIDIRQKSTVYIGEYPILTMQKRPALIVFHDDNITRSRTMRALKAELLLFLERYLPHIEIQEDTKGNRSAWREDRTLVMENVPKQELYRFGHLDSH